MPHGRRTLLASIAVLALASWGVSHARAAEDCSDLSRVPDCPPVPAACAPNCPPQDCSTCTAAVDDDGDCALDEEILNGVDDDGDGMIDEDISCLNTCDAMNTACPSSLFGREELGVPHPVAERVRLPARVRAYDCTGAEAFRELDLVLEPDPDLPDPACGSYRVIVSLAEPGDGTVHLSGPAMLVHSRRWESLDRDLLDPPASGLVRVFRYVIRADLARPGSFASLPAELAPPCLDDAPGFAHVFFYGHLDLAVDGADPTHRRVAAALHHAPSSLSHPPTFGGGFCETDTITGRPLDPGVAGSHDGGWMVAAPADTFAFATDVPTLLGDFRHGKVRYVPTGNQPCEKESRICVSQFELPEAPAPMGACGPNELYRHVRYCANQPDQACSEFALSSDTRCDTIPDDLVAFFPAGRWSGTTFPANMEVSFFEGALSCVPPAAMPFRPYWYGSAVMQERLDHWRGPERSLDLVDNQHADPNGGGFWKIGAVNWAFEGLPNERFAPLQFRTMYFFPDQNPDIPTLAPCVAEAVITEAGDADCTGELTVSCTSGAPVDLSGECSTVENCCQCGELEYQWSVGDAPGWTVVRPWDADPVLSLDPGPAEATSFRLEVRCSTSRTACVAETEVLLVPADPPSASPTATPDASCAGGTVSLDAGACPGCTCEWTAEPGPAPAAECAVDVAPAMSTLYSVVVTDPSTGCSSSPESVAVTVQPTSADAGADVEACRCNEVLLMGSGGPLDCVAGLEYRWRRLAPTVEWACGDETTWLPALDIFPQMPCEVASCEGTFELQVRCLDVPDCVAADTIDVTLVTVDAVLTGGAGCDVASVTIDASGSNAQGCDGEIEYRFTAPSGIAVTDWTTSALYEADETGTWTVEVRCSTSPGCPATAQADVVLERPPDFGAVVAVDDTPCAAGLTVSWDAATFHGGGGGTYAVYRATGACPDPAVDTPLVQALAGLSTVDDTTVPGTAYTYRVAAEDGVPATACLPGGPGNGGPTTSVCAAEVTDAALPPAPEGACYTLRARHDLQRITMDWTMVRALLPGEHFHLLKIVDDPTNIAFRVNSEGDTSLTHEEEDTSSPLQFFDLRIANECETESEDDVPPGYDVPRPECP